VLADVTVLVSTDNEIAALEGVASLICKIYFLQNLFKSTDLKIKLGLI